ncbi:MAG: FAD-binding oxidoreductase [Gemmatimonadales bacterium]|nr:FAD-binding oxidoreductase [Gemmatimonadales bacterium]
MTAPPNVQPAAGLPIPVLPEFNGTGRTDAYARAAYAEGAGIFRIMPAAVAVPSTTAALRDLVLWAVRRRVPLVPRGAGSGMGGGNVGAGVIVDLTALDGCPLVIRPEARRAYSGAGVTLRDLAEEAARAGLRLPPNPSSARFATAGGMAATNAAGPRSVRSGSVRPWIEAVELITGDGDSLTLRRGAPPRCCPAVDRFMRDAEPELLAARTTILARFPKTRKNSSGYALDAWLASGDLLDLMIGAEGTLGIVTGIEWRLVPSPTRYAGIRAALKELEALPKVVPQLLEVGPAALEYLDASFLRIVGREETGGLLMVEFEGDEGDSLEERLREARRILRPHSAALEEATDRRALEELWAIRHAVSPTLAGRDDGKRSMQVIEDACVPVGALREYITAVREITGRHGVEAIIFGHAGDGNLHVNLLPDLALPDWRRRVTAIFAEVTEAVIELGGTPSGEHGDGRLRAHTLQAIYGPEVVSLFRLVKEAFDPVGILNPGVKLPVSGERPFESLKFGPDAADLPGDMAERLREIERSAGYGVSRLELAGPL